MLENTLPQLEQLIEQIIEKNTLLKSQVATLEQQKSLLADENEMLQLEVLESEEKQKQTSNAVTSILGKLQSVEELS
jgi:cell division protein ZapB